MTEVTVGTVKIKRDRTTWGMDAFSIENIDGHNESVMFWVEDWSDLLEGRGPERIERIRHEEEERIPTSVWGHHE